jgi:hypothetical protein
MHRVIIPSIPSLPTNKLARVVTGRILGRSASGTNNLTRWRHKIEPQDESAL